MKKSLILSAFVIALLILVATVPCAHALTRGTALVVHGTADGILEGDRGVADKLTSYGFDVDIMLAADCDENTWVDYDIIFIGESVMSADVGTKFTEADCVVIVSEPGNYDELLMGNYDSQYDTENVYSKGSYIVVNDIVNCGLSKFEGFSSEEVAPGFLLEWGAGGVVVVENEKGSPAVTVFSPGSELFDRSSALNYRIQWFFRGQDAVHATDDAWKVFESVINYVMPLPVPEETAAETIAEAETVTTETTAAAQTSDTVMILSFIVAAAAIPVLKKRK
jgi:hypothetical protein